MSWTKRQFVEQAFDEIGYAPSTYELQTSLLNRGLYRLDAMMASWDCGGIVLGYPLPSSPEASNIEDETNVPDCANEAIYTNLAIRIAHAVGKVPSQDLKNIARRAHQKLLIEAAFPDEQQLGPLPAGQGNKPWRWNDDPFLDPPSERLLTGEDNELEFE